MNKISKRNPYVSVYAPVASLLLLLLVGGVILYSRSMSADNTSIGKNKESSVASSSQSFSDDPMESNSQSKDSGAVNSKSSVDKISSNSNREVSVAIIDASQYGDVVEARAYASDISADSTCKFTFEKDSVEVTRDIKALTGAQNNSCVMPTIPVSNFPSSGRWILTINYHTATKSIDSKSVEVEVKK